MNQQDRAPEAADDARAGIIRETVLAGFDEILDRHFQILEPDRPARWCTTKACRALSTATRAIDVRALVEQMLAQISANLRKGVPARQPSRENWRFVKKLDIAEHNLSSEKRLEKAIARVAGEAWANQVPTASGLMGPTRDRHRNIDLVHQVGLGHFELIELKTNSNTPLHAALELLQHAALYLIARDSYPAERIADSELLRARRIDLQVLAPAAYYRPYRLGWLAGALSGGLQQVAGQRPGAALSMSFAFAAFPDSFVFPCPDEELGNALARRTVAVWA